ncbi:hypothetical protein H0X06_05510 [Candidatus Dependentiae bacterium]|nr:hypothetical protein [Candidatus Dependentiae bacterium]
MHKIIIVGYLLTALSVAEAGIITSHTFFSVRPYFQSAMPERVSLFRNDLLDEGEGLGGAFEVVTYGGQLTEEGSQKLSRFFLPPGCNLGCLNVKEFNPVLEANPANTDDGNPAKDIEARHFNIRTVNETFASRICIVPFQNRIGIGFCYKQTLSHKYDGSTGFWFEGSLPIERVENFVKLTETISNDGGGPRNELGLDNSPRVGNMKEAFAQCSWMFGRIPCKKLRKWGVADIELKIGYNSFSCETYSINSYVGLIIPTGTRIRGRELFEPVVGNNHHFGLNFGNAFAFEIFKYGRHAVQMFVASDTRYLISNYQVRSFDYNGKPWGRYMESYRSSEEASTAAANRDVNSGTSGINLSTRCVRVSPNLSSTINTGFQLTRQCEASCWMLEAGYNFFARQAEHIELECSNTINNSAFKGINGSGTTTVARTIKNNFENSVFTLEQRYAAKSNCDIDLESASHPATISNTVYATLGYRWDNECPYFVALGGSYEFTVSKINSPLDRWIVWGKLGFTF